MDEAGMMIALTTAIKNAMTIGLWSAP